MESRQEDRARKAGWGAEIFRPPRRSSDRSDRSEPPPEEKPIERAESGAENEPMFPVLVAQPQNHLAGESGSKSARKNTEQSRHSQ